MKKMRPIVIIFAIIILSNFIIGCGEDESGEAILNIQLKLAPEAAQQAEITRVIVIISGPDIDTQEIELKVDGRKASGVVAVPAGEERTIQVKAYAGDSIEFEGEAFVDHPEPGTEIPLVIQLKPTKPSQQEEKIFEIGNIGGVYNYPTSPSVFTLDKPYVITQIITYHWNSGQGSTPGTISLSDANRKTYGPWQATGSDGQSGVKNAYWTVKPNIEFPAGTYTVIDSDPSTWAQNDESDGQGFVVIMGYLPDSGTPSNSNSVITAKDGAKMVLIPAGEFAMGDNDGDEEENPEHAVYLDAFYMDLYEVTNAQYKEFVRATGHKQPEGLLLDINNPLNQTYFKPWNDPDFNMDNYPVTCVTWEDANAYAEWAGKRLPTEAEWEKAARGGSVGQKYTWGNNYPPTASSENIADESFGKKYPNWNFVKGYNDGFVFVSPVGRYKSNAYGIFDMGGNVSEMCADWYGENYYSESPKQNPKGPATGEFRVIRGLSWFNSGSGELIIANRAALDPPDPINILGFRCAKDAK